MMNRILPLAIAMLMLSALPYQAVGEPGNAARGERMYRACIACHSLESNRNLTGPSLAEIWNRKAGSLASFPRCSPALRSSGIIWTDDTLDEWIKDPQHFIPGNTMTFPGMKDARQRADLLAFLKEATQPGHAPKTAQGGNQMGGMMGMGGGQVPNLKKLDPQDRVQSINHCGDTYKVATADGKVRDFWERNLRFKTDVSDDGPQKGAPAIVGAGMMGDRADVIFAGLQEGTILLGVLSRPGRHHRKLNAEGRIMIWNSVPLMTAIDLLIIAVAIYGIWRCRLFIPGRRPSASRIGIWLIASGLLVVCLFYAADLISMHALPAVTSGQEAMALMDALHRHLSWLVVLLAVITISTGFIKLLTELQEREARARRLVDSNIIGVSIWGPDGRIIDANEAFLSIVGYGRDDLVSSRLRWRELTPAEWDDADDRRAAELKAIGTAQPYEEEFLHKNGNRVPVLVGAANFEGKGDEGVAFVIDLTDRKRAEAAVRESERRYREAQMELAHANRIATMGHLSASIAHEINQPIGAVIASAAAASRWLDAQPPDLGEVRKALALVVGSGVRAGEVIDRIRALVKKAPPHKDRLEVNEAVLEVIGLTRNEMAKNGISVRTQLAEILPAIQGDRVQLQQVVLNLLINAIDAMRGMSEGVRELLISTAKTDSEGVLVAVRDSGPGLVPESLERLFEAFYTTKPGGLGMGLSICRSIIEAHQGRLWASANVPRGAVFQFTVPASPDTGS